MLKTALTPDQEAAKQDLARTIQALAKIARMLETAKRPPQADAVRGVIEALQTKVLSKFAASALEQRHAIDLDAEADTLDRVAESLHDFPDLVKELDAQATILRQVSAVLWPPPQRGERGVTKTTSMVDRLAAKQMGVVEPVQKAEAPAPSKSASMVERLAQQVTAGKAFEPLFATKVAMVERLKKNAKHCMSALEKAAEAKYHSLEDVGTALAKIHTGLGMVYKAMQGAEADLEETAKELQQAHMDLMASKVFDLSKSMGESQREVSTVLERLAQKMAEVQKTAPARKPMASTKPATTMVERLAQKASAVREQPWMAPIPEGPKKASMLERLMKNAKHCMSALEKAAEAKYHSLEEANKAVTKIYEAMQSANADLKETAQGLQQQNMDLMAAKLLDMSRALDESDAYFQSKFPHLITWGI